jgi:hypothetical protein
MAGMSTAEHLSQPDAATAKCRWLIALFPSISLTLVYNRHNTLH